MDVTNFSTVTHKDYNKIVFYSRTPKEKAWAVVSQAADLIDTHVTRHWLCAANLPEVLWKIPLGKPVYDEFEGEKLLDNSIGGKLWELGQKLWITLDKKSLGTKVLEVDITDEQYMIMHPEMSFLFEDDDE